MKASMFEAMAVALMERPEDVGIGSAPDDHIEKKSIISSNRMEWQQISLAKADPNAFYSDAAFFAKPPLRPSHATCSVGVRCRQSQALIACFSCARFEGGAGHYCRACFEAYHPWYRVAHMWSWLEDTADNKEELDHQVFRTSLERSVADVRGLLQRTSCWRKQLDAQHADTKGDDLIKEAARHATRVGVKIRDLAGMTSEDRTKVSKDAVDGVIRQAVRFQKKYEAKYINDGASDNIGGNI